MYAVKVEMTSQSFAASCDFITFVLHIQYSAETPRVASGFIT